MTANNSPRSILDLSRDELIAWVEQGGERPYRADQIRKWIFGKRIVDFEGMHDVSKVVRERLQNEFRLFSSEIVDHQIAKDRTEKLLLRLHDGHHVECVLMREPNRRTVCISTQVGCAMGCVFCASGLLGVKRNLTTGEILEQVLQVDRLLDPDERLTNVVVMGIGEPLANLRNLLPALDTLNDKGGMGLGYRRITISTVGLPEKIREFASHDKPYSLAVSLHAPNDELRTRLVPVNKNIGIGAILEAADNYFAQTGRRITYEYVLLRGQNDSPEHAAELGRLLSGRAAHVNLIPMNAIGDLPFAEPGEPQTRAFFDILARHGVVTTVRKRKGADIDAACGQLRLERERAENDLVDLTATAPAGA